MSVRGGWPETAPTTTSLRASTSTTSLPYLPPTRWPPPPRKWSAMETLNHSASDIYELEPLLTDSDNELLPHQRPQHQWIPLSMSRECVNGQVQQYWYNADSLGVVSDSTSTCSEESCRSSINSYSSSQLDLRQTGSVPYQLLVPYTATCTPVSLQ